MSKNIEKIKGEEAISEIVDITLDDAKLNGLVSNSVADVYQSASGLKPLKPIDAYESPIVELKANLKLIFRRLFSVPLTILGSNKTNKPVSIISMIEQMFNYYRERLKGSEEYGIPSRLSQLTDLPSATALLADRKISGVPEAADGMSIVQLLLTANTYTELKDNTILGEYQEGYGITNNHTLSKMLSQFSSVTKLSVGWSKVTAVATPGSANIVIGNSTLTSLDCYALKEVVQNGQGAAFSFPNAVVDFSKLEKFSGFSLCHSNGNAGLISRCANETLDLANLQSVISSGSNSGRTGIVPIASSCTNLKRVLMPKMSAFASDNRIGSQYQIYYFWKCPNIEEIEVGTLTSFNSGNMFYSENNSPLLKLKKVVIGEGTAINLNFAYWEPSAETIADADFLQNFKTYIALRLTDNGKGLTLILSQEVRNAIHAAEDEYGIENIIITQKGWTISPAPN